MNDYAHNTQFNHWNELLIQKECGNLDFFHCFFFSNMSENNPIALMLARSADFWISEKFFLQIFLISGKETFPKFGQIWKLFRDDYHNLMKNIHPWCNISRT